MLSLAIDNTNPNSRAPSSRANKAGGDSSSPVAGTPSNSQVSSVPAELTGEGFPAILQPSPVIAIPLPIADSQADRPLASAGANAASLFYSTWSPWSVCKGSI